MRKLALLSLTVLLLTGCNPSTDTTDTTETTDTTTEVQSVFTTDFAELCNGIAMTEAAPYTEDVGTHPVLLFGRESSTETYYEKSFTLPEAWQVDWQDAAQYQLVTCVTPTPTEAGESCDFDVEGETYVLDMFGADYTVDLYVAQTGEKLASTTFELPADECPSLYYFTAQNEESYPDFVQPLTEFLKPYVQK